MSRRFTWFDVTLVSVSLLTFLLDVASDIAVTVQLFLNDNIIWASLTTTLTVLPLLITNAFSLKWHFTDGSLSWSTICRHVMLSAPVHRYTRVLYLGFKSCRSGHPRHTDAALREQSDASILRLFQTFLESAPQLVLQVYLILLHPQQIGWLQVASACCSLVSVAWALAVYADTCRLGYQTACRRRLLTLLLHSLCHLAMVAARAAAFVLFASLYHAWICLVWGIHWLLMTIWICMAGTDYGKGRVEPVLFQMASGFIYIFVYLNLHRGSTRNRMMVYYSLVLLENAALYAAWFISGDPSPHMKVGSAALVFGGFLFGVLCLIMYYRWFHPSGPNYLFTVKSTLSSSHCQRIQAPRVKERCDFPDVEHSAECASILEGSTLELSIESDTPNRDKKKDADGLSPSTAGGVVAMGALQSAWQSGLDSSDSSSSSTSSLDADQCSLDAFNSSALSPLSDAVKSQSRLENSQRRLSSSTVDSGRSDRPAKPKSASSLGALHAPLATDSDRSPGSVHRHHSTRRAPLATDSDRSCGSVPRHHSTRRAPLTTDSDRSPGSVPRHHSTRHAPLTTDSDRSCGSVPRHHSTRHAPLATDSDRSCGSAYVPLPTSPPDNIDDSIHSPEKLGFEAEQASKSTTQLHYEPDNASDVESVHSSACLRRTTSRLKPSSSVSLPNFGRAQSTSFLIHQHNLSVFSSKTGKHNESVVSPAVYQPKLDASKISSTLSPLDISKLFSESKCRESPCASCSFSPDSKSSSVNQLWQSLGLDESPINLPSRGNKSSSSVKANLQESYVVRNGREAMASYPGLVESMSPEQQRLYAEGCNESAGGESMWGISPNLSSSSSRTQPPGFTPATGSAAGTPVADSFDSESESACMNAVNLQDLKIKANDILKTYGLIGNQNREEVDRRSVVTPASPAETSWSSMNVNDDEMSGLNNLKNLTPDDSLCSFASGDKDETFNSSKHALHGERREALGQCQGAVSSRSSTPGLPRCKSFSSLCSDLAAGMSPSPPPGLRKSRTHSSPQHHGAEAVWPLDYLNLDPAPAVEGDSLLHSNDPREILIEVLMNQLRQACLQLNHLHSETAQSSHLPAGATVSQSRQPTHGFDWQMWQHLFQKQKDNPSLSFSESLLESRSKDQAGFIQNVLHMIRMQQPIPNVSCRTSDSNSPEVYVSGKYQPPIVSPGEQQAAHDVCSTLPDGREKRHSKMERKVSREGLAVKPSSFLDDTLTLSCECAGQFSECVGDCPAASEREGLYRYFLDSDSPVHTPLWNTPHVTPIPTPATCRSGSRLLHPGPSQHQPHSGRADSSGASHRQRTGSNKPNPATHSHSLSAAPGNKGQASSRAAMRLLSNTMGVSNSSHADSAVHGRMINGASYRQPLQSLDNALHPSPPIVQVPATKSSTGKTSHQKTSGHTITRV